MEACYVIICLISALANCDLVNSEEHGGLLPTKSYVLNLDLPPIERWTEMSKDYAIYSKDLIRILTMVIGSPIKQKIIVDLAEVYHSYLKQPYKDEVTGLAKGCNISIGYATCLNLFYSLTANQRQNHKMCTSIVSIDRNGTMLHGRNLDFDYNQLLRNITFSLSFQRNGKEMYSSTGFFGQVGLFTAQKPQAFTISLDERHTGEWWMAIMEILTDGRNAHVPSFLIRDVMEEENDFDDAVVRLSTAHQLASSYYIVGGMKPLEGAIVTHGRWTTPDVFFMNQTDTKWFMVETNYDHWTSPPPHDDRRDIAINAMNKVGQSSISLETLLEVLSVKRVANNHTIYTALMCAKHPELAKAFVRNGRGIY